MNVVAILLAGTWQLNSQTACEFRGDADACIDFADRFDLKIIRWEQCLRLSPFEVCRCRPWTPRLNGASLDAG